MIIHNLTPNEVCAYMNLGYELVLYGAGTGISSYARIAFAALDYLKIEPKFWVDDDEGRHGKNFLGLEVCSIKKLDKKNKTLILVSSNYFRTIFNNIETLRSDNLVVSSLVGILESVPAKAYLKLMSFEEVQRRAHTHKSKLYQMQGIGNNKYLYVNALDIQVTEKCTMKCKDCSNLMQYYSHPNDADDNLIIESLDNFLSSIDKLADARVIGGEPFLVKSIDKLLKYLDVNSKVERVTIYTNGTIIPRENVLKALKSDKICVEITDYDALSRNHNALIQKLSEYQIKYFSHKPQNWTDSARIVQNNLTDDELSEMFNACCVNDALTLLHGRLYHCPFSANAVNLKAFAPSSREYLDLSNRNDLRDKFSNFYYGRPYLEACRYCLGRDYLQPLVEPGVQIKKSLDIPIVSQKC